MVIALTLSVPGHTASAPRVRHESFANSLRLDTFRSFWQIIRGLRRSQLRLKIPHSKLLSVCKQVYDE
jgi:hypothetical protein